MNGNREILVSPEREGYYLMIGIQGGLGVGKTELAMLLADKLKMTRFEERYRENPFLDPFYNNPAENSFQSQCFFLKDKVRNLLEIPKETAIIIDPTHWQDTEIYAPVHFRMGWMTEEEYEAYQLLCKKLTEVKRIPIPDIVISVHAPVDVVMRRIKERGRRKEMKMLREQPHYYARLARRAEAWARRNPHNIPIVVVDSGEYNYVDSPRDAFLVVNQVQREVSSALRDRKDIILPPGFVSQPKPPLFDPNVRGRAKRDRPFGRK